MKQLIPLFLLIIALEGAPAYSQEVLTGLVNSYEEEKTSLIMNEKGFVQEVKNKVTTFEYITKEGTRVSKDYKVKGLKDSRRFRVRHPFLYLLAPLLPTLLWEGARALTPIP